MAEIVGRSAQAQFRKQMKEQFGLTVKFKTIDFTDLARCSQTFAYVSGNIHVLGIEKMVWARELAKSLGLILNFTDTLQGISEDDV